MKTEKEYTATICRNLRRILAEEEITQVMLAEWTGIPKSVVGCVATGTRSVSAAKLYRIATVLKRPMEAFFKEDEE